MARYCFLAPGFPLPFSPLGPEAFEEIKCLAGQVWKQHIQENAECSTTYSGAYGNKRIDVVPTHSHATPSSPTRAHKPHPSEVFLVNQLHQLPGPYSNPKHTAATDTGFRPYDGKKLQVNSHKVKYKSVAITSPVTPLDVIQQGIKKANVNVIVGNQSGEKGRFTSSSSQDMLTGWPVTESSHSIELPTEQED
ncbi:uncharacterized protein C4orf51 homolog [Sceloporus undulatus]|uniref:uncharacterized protein C4orf51 homolog n=1 Tax=Sceloporus undulatus TaxID=8520 RepID=UPI001C4D775F|nr:uncharacterized protein C4orf51 homolog [Sceloporus undulatus]